MRRTLTSLGLVFVIAQAAVPVSAQHAASTRPVTLDSTTKLTLTNARALWVEYRGRRALKLAPREGHERDMDQDMAAALTESDFQDGVIEIEVSGAPRRGYTMPKDSSSLKGFIGVSFRVHGDTVERFYIRPENARWDNQLFRNRATQYVAEPDFPFQRLREENPGVYESYVDLESGAWTKLRIEVSGTKARLFVNGATQPTLVVNDLKHGDGRGQIGLWARITSEAYFSNLRVQPK